MANSGDCTAWVARIIKERSGFERKLKEANKLLHEANDQIEALRSRIKELEECIASKQLEITRSSN